MPRAGLEPARVSPNAFEALVSTIPPPRQEGLCWNTANQYAAPIAQGIIRPPGIAVKPESRFRATFSQHLFLQRTPFPVFATPPTRMIYKEALPENPIAFPRYGFRAMKARSSSGPGCLPLTEEITGSNPVRAISPTLPARKPSPTPFPARWTAPTRCSRSHSTRCL